MKITEIKVAATEELKKKLDESYTELFNLRFRLATKQLVNHREIPKVKRRISRIKTILKERELSGQAQE